MLSEEEIASIYGNDLLGVSEPEEPDRPGEGGNEGNSGSGGNGGSGGSGSPGGSGGSSQEIQEPEESHQPPFSDVPEGAWYEEAVRYVRENDLMEGTSSDSFEPAAELTRAMMAQLLYNRAGRPDVSKNGVFDDVSGSRWYADAVAWAASEGIVNGVTESRFAPDQPITREQLAAMMYRYAGSPEVSDLTLQFSDADEVSDYAADAVRWAVSEGVINGNDDGTLNPAGNTTRAETAQLLMNYFSRR